MSGYGISVHTFWTGETGAAIAATGGKDAQLLALYLTFNEHANMLGLYRLRVDDARRELHTVTGKGIVRAFEVLEAEAFAFYDPGTAFVWIREMARFRLGIRDERPLAVTDNKVIGARKLYAALPGNPFLGLFFDRYATVLHLEHRRTWSPRGPEGGDHGHAHESIAKVTPSKGLPRGSEGASEGLPRGSEGASKPVTDQDQSTEIRVQRERTGPAAPTLPLLGRVPATDGNLRVITKLAHEVYDQLGEDAALGDVAEAVKRRCAALRIDYALVRKAIDSARVQRQLQRKRA